MPDQIRVESSELEACVAAYKTSLSTLEDAVNTYEKALDALRNDWTGRAFAAMSAKVLSLVLQIRNSFQRVNDAVEELNFTKDLFEENEAKLTNRFTSLDEGTKSPFEG